MKFEIINTPPPRALYKKIKERFGAENVDWEKGIVFTVGDKIYCKFKLRQDLITHEKTHIKQQAEIGVDIWWDKYLSDDSFRYDEELEAYRNQYRWIKHNIKDRNKQNDMLHSFARDLSGGMYGGLVSMSEAVNAIKQ